MNHLVDVDFLGGHTSKSGVPKEGVDRTKIDKLIEEASKGSKFYAHQQRREQKIIGQIAILYQKKVELEADARTIENVKHSVEKFLREAEENRDLSKTYFHVDMDAFYAAVEMLRRPELNGKPMAVGSDSMLCTANYEARKYGVSSAMPGYIARKLCPSIIIIPPDHSTYKKISDKVHEILVNYDPAFLSCSLDEACMNVTDYLQKTSICSTDAAEILRKQIADAINLTCSVGIAPNRQLAKICSNINKPNGKFCLPHSASTILDFMKLQPVKRISGIGNVTAKILDELLGIRTCDEIIKQAVWIRLLFSQIRSDFLLRAALGLGNSFGEGSSEWCRKSISTERTFKTVYQFPEMQAMLYSLCEQLAIDLLEQELAGKTVGIKVKSSQFDVQTRVITVGQPVYLAKDLYKYASQLLAKIKPADLRLLGVRLCNLVDRDSANKEDRYQRLDQFLKQTNTCELNKPECPVCGKIIEVHPEDMLRINAHIDQCIIVPPKHVALKKTSKTLYHYFYHRSS